MKRTIRTKHWRGALDSSQEDDYYSDNASCGGLLGNPTQCRYGHSAVSGCSQIRALRRTQESEVRQNTWKDSTQRRYCCKPSVVSRVLGNPPGFLDNSGNSCSALDPASPRRSVVRASICCLTVGLLPVNRNPAKVEKGRHRP
jgi:hypothetical protein